MPPLLATEPAAMRSAGPPWREARGTGSLGDSKGYFDLEQQGPSSHEILATRSTKTIVMKRSDHEMLASRQASKYAASSLAKLDGISGYLSFHQSAGVPNSEPTMAFRCFKIGMLAVGF